MYTVYTDFLWYCVVYVVASVDHKLFGNIEILINSEGFVSSWCKCRILVGPFPVSVQ